MKLLLASIAARAGSGPSQTLLVQYTSRLAGYLPVEARVYRTEQAFLDSLEKHRARTAPWLVLLDSSGAQLSSTALAARLREQQDSGRQLAIFAVGPADGWSEMARALTRVARPHSSASDTLLLSLGPMTLPHELARILVAEQLYRACTILAGHPYHSGH